MAPTGVRDEEPADEVASLPAIALRDLVFFPFARRSLLMGRRRSLAAVDEATGTAGVGRVLLLSQRDAFLDDPQEIDLYRVGTVAKVLGREGFGEGADQVLFEGLYRARTTEVAATAETLAARFEPLADAGAESGPAGGDGAPGLDRLVREVAALYSKYARLQEEMPDGGHGPLADGLAESLADGDWVRLSYLVGDRMELVPSEKQEILSAPGLAQRLGLLRSLLSREVNVLKAEDRIDRHLRHRLGGALVGDRMPASDGSRTEATRTDADELEQAVRRGGLPDHARERALNEIDRLRRLGRLSPEAAVARTYVDWIMRLPWSGRSERRPSVDEVAAVLDEDHYGLAEVKERILDHVAVMQLVGDMPGPILCVAGPPGVGKTSLARSIARALGRGFARVSLGGVRDEAEIRGHRRTYVGAMPGKVLQGMARVGAADPVFLLDEVDKMASDFHGDPAAALLEVLDPEHNGSFADHYLELDYDLSDVLFLATANTLQDVPVALRDRMEVIRLPGYLDTEKREIATRFLWPRLSRSHGLNSGEVEPTPEAIDLVVARYTREAGVRELRRQLSRVARKMARRLADGSETPSRLEAADLRDLLGPAPYSQPSLDDDEDRVGIANGLAWTSAGGAVLDVEVSVVPGSGELRLTGTLGGVMRESAQAAVTYARSRAGALGLDAGFHESVDIHVHIPEGATPKDGPSAGITIAVAIVSALTDTPTRRDVATTGEITLRGRVLPVGGIKEKAVGAMRVGLRSVVLPVGNAPDLEMLPAEVRRSLDFELVANMDEVMEAVLAGGEAK